MRLRNRRKKSYRPGTSELEKVFGASSLAVGSLAGAISPVEQPRFGDFTVLPAAPQHQPPPVVGPVAAPRSAAATDSPSPLELSPDTASPAEAGSGFAAQDDVVPSRTDSLADVDAGGLIRRLSLAPSAQAVAATMPQPANSPRVGDGGAAASAPVQTGNGGAPASQVNGAASAATTAPAASANANAASAAASGGQSGALGMAVLAALGSQTNAPGSSAVVLNSRGSTGGLPLGNGFAATGGSQLNGHGSHSGPGIAPDTGSGGSGGGGGSGGVSKTWSATGTVAGTSSANLNAGGTSYGSSYPPSAKGTIPGTGQQNPTDDVTAHIAVISGGGFISSQRTFQLYYSGGPNGVHVTNVIWSASGPPIMDQTNGQYIPDPASPTGGTTFTDTPYNLAAYNDKTALTNLSWGQVPGQKTISAQVTLADNVGSVTLDPFVKVSVNAPGWTGAVKVLKSAAAGPYIWPGNQSGPDIVYGNFYYPSGGATRVLANLGINWSTMQPYFSKQGTAIGRVEVVQLIDPTSSVVVKNSAGTVVAQGFYNPSTGTFAPFPLVDVPSGDTQPFYSWLGSSPNVNPSPNGTGDAPYGGLLYNDTTTINETFTDYVMFQATNAVLWVPLGNFSWHIDASTKLTQVYVNGRYKPHSSTTTVSWGFTPTGRPAINYSAWEPGWSGLSGNYTGYNPPI